MLKGPASGCTWPDMQLCQRPCSPAVPLPIPMHPSTTRAHSCYPGNTCAHPLDPSSIIVPLMLPEQHPCPSLCLSRNRAHTSLLQQYLPHPLCPSITVPNVFALAGAHPDTPAVPAPTLRWSQPCTRVVLLSDVCLSEVSSWLDIIETKAAHIVSAGWVRPPARGRETHQPGGAPACRPAVLQWRRCHRVTTSSLKLRCTCCVSS